MPEFTYGPVELLLLAFDGVEPPPSVVEAITELLEEGTIRLLDLMLVSRSREGAVTAVDIEDVSDEYGFGSIELEATGLAAEDDIQELAEGLPLGSSAALLVIEHRWAKNLTDRLAASGGFVVHSDRIPAPIVNAELAALASE